MNDLEDLLIRTMRDPDAWRMSPPADPLAAIRARARSQRRRVALAAAVAVVLAAATLVLPVTLTRLAGPLPTATTPGDGLLRWDPRGDLIGDHDVLRSAAKTWTAPTGPVRLLYAGRVGPATVVVLQARTADGPAVAQVTDGKLVAADRLTTPLPALLQLVDPAPAEFQVRLLAPPAADRVAWGDTQGLGQADRGADGLVLLEKALHDPPMTVVPLAAGQPLGTGLLPPVGQLPADPSQVVLTTSTWDRRQSVELTDRILADAARFAEALGGGPLQLGQLSDNSVGIQVGGDRSASPRFYDVQHAGVSYLASLVDLRPAGSAQRDEITCVHLERYTGAGPNAVLARCPLPQYGTGVIAALPRTGYQVDSVTVGPTTFEPGDRNGLLLRRTGPGFPARAGSVTLRDDRGRVTRLPVPRYQP